MKQSRKTLYTTIALTVVGLVSIGLTNGIDRFEPEQFARGVFSGGQHMLSAIGRTVSGTVRSVGELRRLREDYEGLLEELEEYQRLEGNIAALTEENVRLRRQLGFVARTEEPLLAARVIAKEAGRLFSSFTINRGSRHGVQPNQAVIAFIGGREGLVGRVSEVSGGTAVVLPVFAAGSYVAARLEMSRFDGLLQGTGREDDPLVLRYVQRNARNEISYGDLITTSGLNSLFPPDLPVGRVSRVNAPFYETALQISVDPVVDFGRLEYVFVLTNSGNR
ncbi:MAG: rod shape-determining protein MreC [Spirochaeta sp.]|jgi:rod shape-determining protein MreC|nr:rod shape-determining protein MreC [Spirochaeta sp.]